MGVHSMHGIHILRTRILSSLLNILPQPMASLVLCGNGRASRPQMVPPLSRLSLSELRTLPLSLASSSLPRVRKDDSFRRKRTDTRQGQQQAFAFALVHQSDDGRKIGMIQLHF